jgi:DNA-binding winged helix-turn-helix (wHTH) protein
MLASWRWAMVEAENLKENIDSLRKRLRAIRDSL